MDLAIPFTIPGERVRVRLPAGRRPQTTARLIEVLRASPHRVTPACVHFGPNSQGDGGTCGGCAWQHIAYPEQLRLKTVLVERLLSDALPGAPRARTMLPSTDLAHPWGFRHRVHFVFDNEDAHGTRSGRLVMGHYGRGTRRVIPVRECPVHDPRGNALAFTLHGAFARAGVHAAGRSGRGALRGVAIRAGHHTQEVAATLVVTRGDDRALRAATRRVLTGAPRPTTLAVNLHPNADALVFGAETRRITGPARMREAVRGTAFAVSPTAFFQTNVAAAEILVGLVSEAVPRDASVLDLYAGAGLFALPLARDGHTVTAVEENRTAVADGEASRSLNGIPPARCQFIARPVESALAALPRADAVVLDPPREGCAPAVMRHLLARLRPAHVVYVSCNPETLARDLQGAAGHGYRVVSIQPVDMFPHTPHVETVVVLTR